MNISHFRSKTLVVSGIMLYNHVVIPGNGSDEITRTCMVVFEDQPDENFMSHYFHFMEYLIALIHGLDRAAIAPQDIDTVFFPHTVGEIWKGSVHDHNHLLLKAFLPSLSMVVTPKEVTEKIKTMMVKQVLVITRKDMEHRCINKMCAGIFSTINHVKIQAFVEAVYQYFSIPRIPVHSVKPLITYIARNRSKRKLLPWVEQALTRRLSTLSGFEFQKVYMEQLSFKEQIEVASKTTIMVGIHGNGLTHAFFMPPRGIIIEIFPKGTFQFDYFSIAEVRDHRYFPFNGAHATPFNKYTLHGSTSRRVFGINITAIAGIVTSYQPFI